MKEFFKIILGAEDAFAQKFDNPFKGGEDLPSLIAAILQVVVQIGAVVVVFFFIYSGFLFVTAGGSEEKIKKAKSNLVWTSVGTIVLIGAQAIATILKNTTNQITGGL